MNGVDILGHKVAAFYAFNRQDAHLRGTVVAYSPQVCIEQADGMKVWWRADLVRDITCDHCGGTGVKQ